MMTDDSLPSKTIHREEILIYSEILMAVWNFLKSRRSLSVDKDPQESSWENGPWFEDPARQQPHPNGARDNSLYFVGEKGTTHCGQLTLAEKYNVY